MNELPALPLAEWDATRVTLRLFVQIVGKVRLALAPAKNHWWHVVLYVTPRGLTTGAMPSGDTTLELEFDFVDHALVVLTERGEVERLPLRDGLSVAAFYEQLFSLLARLGIDVDILAQSYGDATPIPFTTDDQDASYDSKAVERFWHALSATALLFEEFSGWRRACGTSTCAPPSPRASPSSASSRAPTRRAPAPQAGPWRTSPPPGPRRHGVPG
jgi:Family of unknown function (DUF5996)